MNRRYAILLLAALCLYISTVSAYNVVGEIVGLVLDKRQDNDTSATPATPTTTTSSIPETSSETTTTTTSSSTTPPPDDETTTTPISTTSTTVETTIIDVATTTNPTSSSTDPESSNPESTDPTSTNPTSTNPTSTNPTSTNPTTSFTPSVTVVIITHTFTKSGSLSYSTEVTTSITTPTGLSDNSKNDSSDGGGISTSTRNTIIGVVVGVGGFIIFGALGIVAFRLRKKKAVAGFNDDIRSSPSSAAPIRQQDAFKATLDQYHKPPGTVNPSANF